jgi:tRNA wybutosine-synthesizing protein 2
VPLRDRFIEFFSSHGGIPPEIFPFLPTGFQQLAHTAIVHFRPEIALYEQQIAEALMHISPQIKAVWKRSGEITGKYREPQGLTLVLGDPTTEIIVSENNIKYKFDFTKIMFAKGNVHERGLLPKRIQKDEIIFDMFTGIGYFTLGMAKSQKPKHIYSFEWNPTAFHYLQENLVLNHVEDLVTPILGDCKIEVPKVVAQGITADRIIMGLLPAPKDAIPTALNAISPKGGIILYEGVEPEVSTELFDEFNDIARAMGFTCEMVDRRLVKSYSPGRYHVVIEFFVRK